VNLTGGSRGLGDGQLHGNEDAVTVKLPIPQTFRAGPTNITVREGTRFEGPSAVVWPHSHSSAGKSDVQHPPVASAS
jgi:hypothetical protein